MYGKLLKGFRAVPVSVDKDSFRLGHDKPFNLDEAFTIRIRSTCPYVVPYWLGACDALRGALL
jgi:hypothetical protein